MNLCNRCIRVLATLATAPVEVSEELIDVILSSLLCRRVESVRQLRRLIDEYKITRAYYTLAALVSLGSDGYEVATSALIDAIPHETGAGLTMLGEAVCAQIQKGGYGKSYSKPVVEALLRDGRFRFGSHEGLLVYFGAHGVALLRKLLSDKNSSQQTARSIFAQGRNALPALEQLCGWFAPEPASSIAKELIKSIEAHPFYRD
jgi:hypothetical protein